MLDKGGSYIYDKPQVEVSHEIVFCVYRIYIYIYMHLAEEVTTGGVLNKAGCEVCHTAVCYG